MYDILVGDFMDKMYGFHPGKFWKSPRFSSLNPLRDENHRHVSKESSHQKIQVKIPLMHTYMLLRCKRW